MNGAAEPEEETITLIGGPLDGDFEQVRSGHPQELLVVREDQTFRYLIDWNLNIATYEGRA